LTIFITVQAVILNYAAASRKADGKEKMKPAAEHTFSYVSRVLESSTLLAALSAAAHDLLNNHHFHYLFHVMGCSFDQMSIFSLGVNDRSYID